MRWGIIGCGAIAREFAEDLATVPSAELAAVASRTVAKAQAFAKEFGFARAHGSYEALYADRDVDIVYVATPHTEHLRNSADAMRAGKHVLCEKPLTVSPDEARMLAAIHAETGVYLMEAMWTWFLPAVRQALTWIEQKRIGALVHIKSDFGYPQPYDPSGRMYSPILGGGALLDMGVYPVALSWLLHRSHPDKTAVLARAAPNGVVDDLSIMLDYKSHTATLGASFRAKLQNWAYIIGTTGYIAIPDYWRAAEAHLYVLDDCVERFVDDRETRGFNFEIETVMQDIAAGRTQSLVYSLDDSIAVQEIMARIHLLSVTSAVAREAR